MQPFRKLIAATVLTLYLLQVLAGSSLHALQCSSVDCCSGVVDSVLHCVSYLRWHSHCHCHHHASESQSSQQPVDDGPHDHDSSDCAVCKTLAQAQEEPSALELSQAEIYSIPATVLPPESLPLQRPYAFQSRGPPSA